MIAKIYDVVLPMLWRLCTFIIPSHIEQHHKNRAPETLVRRYERSDCDLIVFGALDLDYLT